MHGPANRTPVERAAIPDRHRLLVETAIETGIGWGELSDSPSRWPP